MKLDPENACCPLCGRTVECACNLGAYEAAQQAHDDKCVQTILRDALPRTHGSATTPAHKLRRYRPARTPWRGAGVHALTEGVVMILVGMAAVGLLVLFVRIAAAGLDADYSRQRSITDEAIRRNVSR